MNDASVHPTRVRYVLPVCEEPHVTRSRRRQLFPPPTPPPSTERTAPATENEDDIVYICDDDDRSTVPASERKRARLPNPELDILTPAPLRPFPVMPTPDAPVAPFVSNTVPIATIWPTALQPLAPPQPLPQLSPPFLFQPHPLPNEPQPQQQQPHNDNDNFDVHLSPCVIEQGKVRLIGSRRTLEELGAQWTIAHPARRLRWMTDSWYARVKFRLTLAACQPLTDMHSVSRLFAPLVRFATRLSIVALNVELLNVESLEALGAGSWRTSRAIFDLLQVLAPQLVWLRLQLGHAIQPLDSIFQMPRAFPYVPLLRVQTLTCISETDLGPDLYTLCPNMQRLTLRRVRFGYAAHVNSHGAYALQLPNKLVSLHARSIPQRAVPLLLVACANAGVKRVELLCCWSGGHVPAEKEDFVLLDRSALTEVALAVALIAPALNKLTCLVLIYPDLMDVERVLRATPLLQKLILLTERTEQTASSAADGTSLRFFLEDVRRLWHGMYGTELNVAFQDVPASQN